MGLAWRNVEELETKVHFSSVYKFFSKLKKQNFFENVYNHAIQEMFMNDSLKLEILSLDTTNIKNIQGIDIVGPCSTDRGRKGSKVSSVTDESGNVLALCFAPANEYDGFIGIPNLMRIPVPIWGAELLVDKGYFGKPFELAVKKLGNKIKVVCPNKAKYTHPKKKNKDKDKTKVERKASRIKRTETVCINGICQELKISRAKKQIKTTNDSRSEFLKKRHVVENAFMYLKSYKRIPRRYDKSMESFKSICYIAALNILYKKLNR